ncbi:MAG: hypothetical protein HY021_06915 [Burkholderiales bacterium]|nr:hypothetical protein [Burkholderiales bacterium]
MRNVEGGNLARQGLAAWLLALAVGFALAGPVEPTDPGSAENQTITPERAADERAKQVLGRSRITETTTGRKSLDLLLQMQIKRDELSTDLPDGPTGRKATKAAAAPASAVDQSFKAPGTREAGIFGGLAPDQERPELTAKRWAAAGKAALGVGGGGGAPGRDDDNASRGADGPLPAVDPGQANPLLSLPFTVLRAIRENREWIVVAVGLALVCIWVVTVRRQRRR